MKRKLILTSFAVLATLVSARRVPAASRPNVVFILADDLGGRDLGCYSSGESKSESQRLRVM